MSLPPIAEVRAGLHARLAELPEEDVRVLAAIVAELPHARLVATCEEETRRGIEGPRGEGADGKPLRVPDTSARVFALGELLASYDRWRVVIGLKPRAVRGVEGVLREERRRWKSSVRAGGGKGT